MFLNFFLFITCVYAREDFYPTRDIDIDEVIHSERLMKNILDCLLDRGICTPEGRALKMRIVESLETQCARCTEQHREGTRKIIIHLVRNKPQWWSELLNKYDPDQKYKSRLDQFLELEGLKN